MQKVLIVDDDPQTRETLSALLEQERFIPMEAADGRTGLDKALSARPNVVLIDVRLPGLNGIEICKQLRDKRFTKPIIVLSAAADEVDKVLLLEMGADDYMVKPFGSRELLARIRAILRRTGDSRDRVSRFGQIEVDIDRRAVTRASKEVKVTPAEYNLLLFFLQNAERVLTRDAILNAVWGCEYFSNTRTVDAHVLKLRQKFEDDPAVPKHFVTVHRVGYRFLA
jgi:DNA-binding response OmpR family regulator